MRALGEARLAQVLAQRRERMAASTEPSQLIRLDLGQWYVPAQRGEAPEEKRVLPPRAQGGVEAGRRPNVDVPLARRPRGWPPDGRSGPGRRPRSAPPSRAGPGSRPRRLPRGPDSRGSIPARRPISPARRRRQSFGSAPVAQDDAVPFDALGEVLVRRTDPDAVHAGLLRPSGRGRRQGVVCLELDHGPDDDSEGLHRPLGQRELGQELRGHAGIGLVAAVQVIAE